MSTQLTIQPSARTRPLPIDPLAAVIQLRIEELRHDAAHQALARRAQSAQTTDTAGRWFAALARALRESTRRLGDLIRPRPHACTTC